MNGWATIGAVPPNSGGPGRWATNWFTARLPPGQKHLVLVLTKAPDYASCRSR
jgi:hypothetical protein